MKPYELGRGRSIRDQNRLSERGEFLVSFFVRPFFGLPKCPYLLYKNPTLALDVSLRRATLYPAELRVRAGLR